MAKELIVERDKLESILPLLGAEVNEEGYVQDQESERVIPTNEGDEVPIEEMGYFGHSSIEPVEDDIPAIVSYLSESDSEED